jgi:hypothetical protein
MSESKSVTQVRTATLTVPAPVVATLRQAAAQDDRFGSELVTQAARQAVTAWVLAVNGDDVALTTIADPDAGRDLLHPVRESWCVAPDPAVTLIDVWAAEPDTEPPRLRLSFEFTGRQLSDDPGREPSGAPTQFVGMLDLTLRPSGGQPWMLSSGHVQTLDQFLGYVFTSRPETAEEYRQRAGSPAEPGCPADPGLAAGPGPAFRVTARFAEHDERFAATVSVEVRRREPLDRGAAEALVWRAIWAETKRALGDGDWRPSLIWLDVVRLADASPAVRQPEP